MSEDEAFIAPTELPRLGSPFEPIREMIAITGQLDEEDAAALLHLCRYHTVARKLVKYCSDMSANYVTSLRSTKSADEMFYNQGAANALDQITSNLLAFMEGAEAPTEEQTDEPQA